VCGIGFGEDSAGMTSKLPLTIDAAQTDRATERLRVAGLRPTRQRVELASHLFNGMDRHVTAESLAEEVAEAGIKVSLATV
jgi:Fur family iron response transcriptional regulator